MSWIITICTIAVYGSSMVFAGIGARSRVETHPKKVRQTFVGLGIGWILWTATTILIVWGQGAVGV